MSLSRWMQMKPEDIVLINPYTGGGFGSKVTGTISSIIPALLSKKANAPVQMRITHEDEYSIGGARPAVYGRTRAGLTKEGKISALDLFVLSDNGPYERREAERYDCVASVSARGDAIPIRRHTDEYPDATPSKPAGRLSGRRVHGKRVGQGRAEARA
jgi:CO/xanthine dehydrogenase Mo-binding subunit